METSNLDPENFLAVQSKTAQFASRLILGALAMIWLMLVLMRPRQGA